jgi:plastocyanin
MRSVRSFPRFAALSRVTAFAVVAAALAIACTGKADSTAQANGKGGPTGSAAVTKSVKVTDNHWSRSSLTIHKNDKVKWNWQNTDNRHNVHSDSGPATFHSKTKSGDFSYSHKFTRTGTYSLFCSRHPDDMNMTVKVKKAS